MGIMDYFRNRESKKVEEAKEETQVSMKENFVADLSFVELQGVDWKRFAGELKRDGVLSGSYDKNPVSIEYSLAKDNSPKVELTFRSKTSDSVRTIQLFKDHAYLIVNGAIEAFPETQRNKDLNKFWNGFQEEIRYRNRLKTNREGYFHSNQGARMLIEAEKKMQMRDIYEREQEFLEMYQKVVFDDFCYSPIFEKNSNGFISYAGELPKFIPLEETPDGHYVSGEPVIPFTPRTLEHCILHMTNGQKIEDGEYPEGFEKKCRELEKYSCFESKDWDKVIEFGKEIVTEKYRESEISETLGFDRE